VKHSRYEPTSGSRHPAAGLTEPLPEKDGAYTWLKAPRYMRMVHEVGPLARMWIAGRYRRGISTVDRLLARAEEAQLIAGVMDGWLDELVPGEPSFEPVAVPEVAVGAGLTEAPRGALGHWIRVEEGKIHNYQVVTPTAWNGSPKDDFNQRGPIEQALVGTPVANADEPVEVLRVVHSFDPCLACAVHVLRPRDGAGAGRP